MTLVARERCLARARVTRDGEVGPLVGRLGGSGFARAVIRVGGIVRLDRPIGAPKGRLVDPVRRESARHGGHVGQWGPAGCASR